MAVTQEVYAARLNIDFPETLDRVTTALRMLWIIPIAIILSVLSAQATSTVIIVNTTGQVVAQLNQTSAGIGGALFAATLLMILSWSPVWYWSPPGCWSRSHSDVNARWTPRRCRTTERNHLAQPGSSTRRRAKPGLSSVAAPTEPSHHPACPHWTRFNSEVGEDS